LPLTVVAQELKFGHLNKRALVESMPEASRAQTELENLLLQKRTEGERMEAELQRAFETFMQEAETLDENVRNTREQRLRNQQENLRTFAQNAERELTLRQQELMLPIENKIERALEQVGKEQGLIYIFDDETLLFKSAQSIDVLPFMQRIVNAPAPRR